jgi:UDP-N-acetyl-2-amino-2-deoxyglucuronate dehydrogenase
MSDIKAPYNFALIGAAGFIAPRHLKAIKDTNNVLLAALDKFDSVGIMDSFFPNADFFTEYERFDRHIDKLRRKNTKVDFISICTPNYLHDSHIRFALRSQANAICEKPLVLNPWNIDGLTEIEKETGKKVYNVLQLRLHPAIIALREKVMNGPKDKIYDVDLTYITSRGNWYYTSWKGDVTKSGGVATNIGVHFFDMLSWIFGPVKESVIHISMPDKVAGYFMLEKARVRWYLSIDTNDIPAEIKAKGQRTYRTITMDNSEIEFSEGFTELHTKTYEHILSGQGFGLQEARQAVETVFTIRNSTPVGRKGEYHPFCNNINL